MKAKDYFENGYNCAQSVVCAFADILKLPEKELFKLSYAFGGGFAREREVCGAVSGMVLVANILFAPQEVDYEKKKKYYSFIRELIEKFRSKAGAIRCADLLGINEKGGNPEERTREYYDKRPCSSLCTLAEEILTEIIKELNNE